MRRRVTTGPGPADYERLRQPGDEREEALDTAMEIAIAEGFARRSISSTSGTSGTSRTADTVTLHSHDGTEAEYDLEPDLLAEEHDRPPPIKVEEYGPLSGVDGPEGDEHPWILGEDDDLDEATPLEWRIPVPGPDRRRSGEDES